VLDTVAAGEGAIDIRVVVTDKAGNQTISALNRLIDNTPPSATFGALPATVRGTVALNAAGDDGSGSGIDTVNIQRRPAGTSPWTDNTPASWNTTGDADGSWELQAVVKDKAGNSRTSAIVTTYVDNNGPLVTSRTPADGAGNVALGSTISFTWNRPMDTSTLTLASGNVTVTGPGGTPVSGMLATVGQTTTFTPDVAFTESTTYTVKLTKAIKAANGYALHDPDSWSFSTGWSVPVVTAKSPAAGATGVATSVQPTATFSTDMDATSVIANATIAPQGGSALAATVTYNALSDKATIAPAAPLSGGVIYVVTLGAATKSTNNVSLAGPVSWSFTTVAAAGPTVVAKSPADGATAVSVGTKPSMTFDQDMDASTLTGSTVTLSNGSNVAGTVSYSAALRTVTFSPTAALANGTAYTLRVDGAAKSSNGLALGTAATAAFTTTTAPEVLTATPANGALNQPMSTKPVITFSMPMLASTITTTNVQLLRADNTTVPTNPTMSGNQLTLLPTTSLDYSATMTIKLSNLQSATNVPMPTWQSTFTTTGDGVTTRLDNGATADYTDGSGNVWLKDQFVSGGSTASNTNTTTNTTDPKLYQTYRWGTPTYTVSMPNGYYDAEWFFSEPQSTYTACGKRKFFVDNLLTALVNDLTVDPRCDSGAVNKASVKMMALVAVPGRAYRFKLVASIDQPLLDAFRVTPHPPTVTATTNSATAVTGTFSQPMRAASIDGSSFTVSGSSGVVAGAVTYDSATTKATFTPSIALPTGTYTATIGSTKDQYGMNQAAVKTWTFSVP
jgi:hypothetical protein